MLLTKRKIKNIMFDLDGTLINSSVDVSRILINSINKNGGHLTSDTKIKLGPPLPDMVSAAAPLLTKEQKQKTLEDYRINYDKDELKQTFPYNGIIDLLKFLKENNIDVFIVTYKPKNLSAKILERYFKNLFIDIITPSEVENFADGKTKTDMIKMLLAKYHLSAEESVMIGDAKSDIMCAKALKLYTIGALYGYGEKDEFVSADKTVQNVNELKAIIKSLIIKE